MDERTLTALKDSIQHWEENAEADHRDQISVSGDDCALCLLFVKKNSTCEGCPVHARTGRSLCGGSPFIAACVAKYSADVSMEDLQNLCRAELVFLRALLPPDEIKDA